MNKNTFIACVVAIVVMPLIYMLLNSYEPEEVLSFRGMPVQTIEAKNGSVTVPNASENASNVPLRASLRPRYMETVSGLKPPTQEPLDLTIQSVSENQPACNDDGTLPEQATFETALTCAVATFEKSTLGRKTALEVDRKEQFIIFGATGNNQVKLYHNGMIANYVSKDMVQSDRKREACIVRIMLDHLVGKPASVESSCLTAE